MTRKDSASLSEKLDTEGFTHGLAHARIKTWQDAPFFIGIFLFYPASWTCLNLILNES